MRNNVTTIVVSKISTYPNDSSSCFGRISESVFSDLKSLDNLITKISTTRNGLKNISVGDPDDFKSRFKHFKEFLKEELPEFTEEDILKFDKHFPKFKKIYEWYGAEYFLTAMEYEARNKLNTVVGQSEQCEHTVDDLIRLNSSGFKCKCGKEVTYF